MEYLYILLLINSTFITFLVVQTVVLKTIDNIRANNVKLPTLFRTKNVKEEEYETEEYEEVINILPGKSYVQPSFGYKDGLNSYSPYKKNKDGLLEPVQPE